jgi:hypothetical protein
VSDDPDKRLRDRSSFCFWNLVKSIQEEAHVRRFRLETQEKS